jgi:hypothetical protein
MYSPDPKIINLANQIAPYLTEITRHSPGDRDYQKCLAKVMSLILTSNVLWQDNSPNYEDALQTTCLTFCLKIQNLAVLGSIDPIHLIFAFNRYLRWRLFDEKVKPCHLELLDNIHAPQDIAIVLDRIVEWIDTDRVLRQTSMAKYSHVTAHIVLKHRFPAITAWKELSRQLNAPVPSLSAFFQRTCLPLLRDFAQKEIF